MKKIILIKHGETDPKGNLNNNGKSQIVSISQKIIEIIGNNPKNTFLLTSSVDCTNESAAIIESLLGIDPDFGRVFIGELWQGNSPSLENFPKLFKKIELYESEYPQTENLVLVTFSKYTNDFGHYYGQKKFNRLFHYFAVNHGEAVVIDCEKQNIYQLHL